MMTTVRRSGGTTIGVLARRALLAAGFVGASTQPILGQTVTLEPGSFVRMEGTSTLHDWSCDAKQIDVRYAHEAARTGTGGPIGELTLPVAALECGDARMERQMRDVLRAAEHPEIRFRLHDYAVEGDDVRFTVAATGVIVVAGVERPLATDVDGDIDADGVVRAAGTARFRMTEFGLRPPSAFFGLLKAGDVVTVRYELLVRPDATQRLTARR